MFFNYLSFAFLWQIMKMARFLPSNLPCQAVFYLSSGPSETRILFTFRRFAIIMDAMNEIYALFQQHIHTVGLREHVSFQELTSFRTGGYADCVLTAESADVVADALSLCGSHGVPMHFLGNGTNILAPDEDFHGLILRLASGEPHFDGELATCGAGTLLSSFCTKAAKAGLAGFEGLSGIPGTIGGAIAMNAGAYGFETADHLSSVTLLRNSAIAEETVSPHMFSYRRSPFSAPDAIVLSAVFRFLRDDGGVQERIRALSEKRRASQPLNLPSAGSVFKRPEGAYAAALIDQCGLKGLSCGDAQVSTKHAGFIVNAGHATSADVLSLIRAVQDAVYQKTGYVLEREIRLLSEI